MPTTPNSHVRMLVAGWLLGAHLSGCGSTPAQAATPAQPAMQMPLEAPAPLAPPVCPRLTRGKRIWTGFKEDVPREHLHLALDVIRPLEDRLGEVFCAPEHAPCRPLHFTSIVLADVLPSAARITLEGGAAAPGQTFELDMLYVQDSWQPEPAGLAVLLAPCARP